MKIENQVCTEEQSKKLEGLGITQKANFYWKNGQIVLVNDDLHREYANMFKTLFIAAFTVAELGEAMKEINNELYWGCSYYNNHHGTWDCELKKLVEDEETGEENFELILESFEGDTEAESRAELLIYLIESGHLPIEVINQRLTA